MAPLLFSNLEYVALRLVRRFLLPKELQRVGRYLPFYRTNLAETEPDHVCRLYVDWLGQERRSVKWQRILEVGSGATNGVGYALACAGAAHVWCVEPYVPLDRRNDDLLLEQVSRIHNREPSSLAATVSRSRSFESVGEGNADIILSHSVLEHVRDLAALFDQMSNALADGGAMLHVVDYRDHFFKYPMHFLQFSAQNWQRFLDPGDLPRWRLADHLVALGDAGFRSRILYQEEDARAFERIRPHISSDFDLADPALGVLRAVLYCERY